MVRLFFVLSAAGAEVFHMNWDLARGKGIDDYLSELRSNGEQHNPADVLKTLLADAKPFIESVNASALDLDLVCSELEKVLIPGLLRDQLSKPLAGKLGVRVEELRRIGARTDKPADFIDPDLRPNPVAGHQLLQELVAIIKNHIVTEDHCRIAIALWIILSYLIDQVDIMPLLGIMSPEKRCGKSRLLSLLLKLVRRPIPAVSLSAASVYRAIEKWHPSLLVDEADDVLKDSRGHDNLELRSVINSGHTRELAYVNRCVGETHDVQRFSTWSPKAIALIGKMPDGMMDRSIAIPMKRKTKAESVARIRETPEEVFAELRSKIVRFVEDNGQKIAQHTPALPGRLNDRAEDCWWPLLAIADVAGGSWPTLARTAALALSGEGDDSDTFVTKLLQALKQDFVDHGEDRDQGFQITTEICEHLNKDKEAPWADLTKFKNQMTPELLAKNLSPYKVKSEQVTLNGDRVRGFHWRKLKPIFDRYL
jgi:putative DNA primase/helicase